MTSSTVTALTSYAVPLVDDVFAVIERNWVINIVSINSWMLCTREVLSCLARGQERMYALFRRPCV